MSEISSDVSVSIVTFNNIAVLKQRLGVLLPIFITSNVSKVFIVDNASQDGTLDVLKEIAECEPLLYIISLRDNKGFGFGHNQAINLTDSKYHIVMNLDTTPNYEGTIKRMADYMDVHSDVALLSPLVRFPKGEIQRLTRDEPTILDLGIRFLGPNVFRKRQEKFVHSSDGYNHEQIILNATGSFMFCRSEVLHSIGGFDEQYFLYMEDTDLTKQVNQVGKAVFSPDFEVVHEWKRGNHSITGARFMIVSMIKYFNKWGWKLW